MQYNFNAADHDPSQGIEIWPDNTWCKVVLTANTPKASKNNERSGMLVWTITGVEGPVQGKVQFIRQNLWNENDQAKNIAERELSALTYVTLGSAQGRLNFNNFDELHNIPFFILSRNEFDTATKRTNQNWGGFKDVNGKDPKEVVPGSGAGAGAPQFGAQPAPAAAPAFGAPAAAPAFGAPAAQAAPAGFAPGAPAPAQQFAAPAAAPAQFGAPPAQAAAPQFGAPPAGAPAGAPAAAPGFVPPGAPAGAPPPFAPPAGAAPAGSPPWGAR